MKPPVSSIHLYNIDDLNADAGVDAVSNDFYVFNDRELPVQEKWFHPSCSAHFSIYLLLNGTMELKYNLLNYELIKNTLFIIRPGIVHETMKASSDCTFISIGFTPDFLGRSVFNKKRIDAFGFFSTRSNPLLSLIFIVVNY